MYESKLISLFSVVYCWVEEITITILLFATTDLPTQTNTSRDKWQFFQAIYYTISAKLNLSAQFNLTRPNSVQSTHSIPTNSYKISGKAIYYIPIYHSFAWIVFPFLYRKTVVANELKTATIIFDWIKKNTLIK